jgi:hypothetical protein
MPSVISNTPQAKDDLYNLSTKFLIVDENTVGYKISQSSLMANDLGGSAKKFYGLGEGSATLDTSAKGSALSVSGTDVIYDPNGRFESLNASQTAEDTFTYTIQMGNGALSTATVKVLVQGKNDKPNSNADFYQLVNKAVADNVLTNDDDVDNGDTLTAVLGTGPTKGVLDFEADGSFTYTQNANAWGNDSFTYRAYDGKEYSELITVTLSGAAEPPKTTFGATKGGVVYEDRYQPGDYYHYKYDYNSYAEALGARDYSWDVPDYTIYNGKAAWESNFLHAGSNFYHSNHAQPETTYNYGTDETGNPLSYTHSYDIRLNASHKYEAVMEFNVSEAAGLVSGATFKFDSHNHYAHDNTKIWPDYYPATLTFDVYVYSGDNAITVGDSGAGVLAGKATVSNTYVSEDWYTAKQSQVSLDADAINAILSSGSDHIGIRFDAAETDHGTLGGNSQNYEFINNINVNTASLEFIYA